MAKNFEDISCIFCGAKNTIRESSCCECKKPLEVGKELVPQSVNGYILVEYKARGFYGLTFKAREKFGEKPFAVKLISKAAYARYDKDFLSEARLFASLPESLVLVRYIGAGEAILKYDHLEVGFFYIVSEWINGISFREYLEGPVVAPEDFRDAANDMLSGLQELYDNKLWHNDLHDENVIIDTLSNTQRRSLRRTSNRLFRIIDVGSMVHRNPADAKPTGDVHNVGSHLAAIHMNIMKSYASLTKEDKFFLDIVQEVITRLIDENPTRNYQKPIDALDAIEQLYLLSRMGPAPEKKDLDSPYGYINANDIPSPWLLTHMFSDKLHYFRNLVSSVSEHCLIISGPRGCGKTMILKNMRFATLYDATEADKKSFFSSLPYIGLFVSSRSNFGNFLVSVRRNLWSHDESKVVFYFNLIVSLEMLDVLYRLTFGGLLSEESAQSVVNYISESFDIPLSSIQTLKPKLIELSMAVVDDKETQIRASNSTPIYISTLIGILRTIELFGGKEFILLIDDVSLPRTPENIQKALCPVLFNTGSSYKVRITTHSDAIVTSDLGGEVYKENRDYREINLGLEYWNLSDDYQGSLDSFNDILNKRFQLSGRGDFPGLEVFLKKGEEIADIGREIHRRSAEKKLRFLNYYGSKVFIKLCSGDLSYLLDILGKMEISAGVKIPIPQKIQNRVIKNYARNELRSLQDIRPQRVSSLYDIAYSFGVWSKSKLVHSDADYIRIELGINGMSEELIITQRELLCYGVFIDGGFSNMSDGSPARKLLFRRIFTPAFPTTFNSRNSFSMRARNFQEFVSDPRNFVRKRMSEDAISPEEQQQLEQLDIDYD